MTRNDFDSEMHTKNFICYERRECDLNCRFINEVTTNNIYVKFHHIDSAGNILKIVGFSRF